VPLLFSFLSCFYRRSCSVDRGYEMLKGRNVIRCRDSQGNVALRRERDGRQEKATGRCRAHFHLAARRGVWDSTMDKALGPKGSSVEVAKPTISRSVARASEA